MVRIAVFGTGGVGGYYGGRLAQAGAEVHLVARGAHLEALRKDGLRVTSPNGDMSLQLPATDDPADIGPCDFVLFAVKSYDTIEAAAGLGPLLQDGTAVVSLQNGIENEGLLAKAIGADHVMGGVSYILAGISEPGVIEHIGVDRIIVGELDGARSRRARLLVDLLVAVGVTAELSDHITYAIWEKYGLICAHAGMTAATRSPLGVVLSTPVTRAMLHQLLVELVAIAHAEGVPLPADYADARLSYLEGVDPSASSSLALDLSRGNRIELEALHGAALRLADRHGVDVPVLRSIYALLKPFEFGAPG
jgi:2-dehydropantoate 2-reductase